MPRKIRHILSDIPHHTIQRGNNRQRIFFEEADFRYFLERLNQFGKMYEVQIGSYCLMTNHVHLLTYPKTAEGMIRCMKMVCQHYTQYVNKKYKRSGKLWENRYKIHWIDPDREWVLARYIEKNPLKAGMVNKAEEYEYSSARANLMGEIDSTITRKIVSSDRRLSYREFFHENDHQDNIEITQTAEQEKAYGSEGFIKKLKELLGINVEYRKRGRPKVAKNVH